MRVRSSAWLEVDGGIDVETLPEMKEAGATAFVAATAIFKNPEGRLRQQGVVAG